MSRKLANGPKGGIPPWKEGQEINLRVAHWCLFGPKLSGMYETVRELVMAENKIEGVLAGMCEVPDPSASKQLVAKAAEGGRPDTMHPTFRTQDWGWALKFCDIHVIHTSQLKQVGELKPKAFFLHGTPEACLENDLQPKIDLKSYESAMGYIGKCEATIVTSERAKYLWQPYDHTGQRIHKVDKGVDLEWWQRTSTKQDLEGKPSVLYGEIWRGIKHPLHTMFAVNSIYQKNPDIRLNVWGCNIKRSFWEKVSEEGGFDKFLGRGIRSIIDWPEHYYTRGDVLVSPGLYGDVSRVHQEAMACLPLHTMIDAEEEKRAIEDIQLGDLVWTHRGRLKPVTKLYRRNYSGRLIRVQAGNNFISPTPEHPILTDQGWINVKRIGPGLYCWTPRWGRVLLNKSPLSITEQESGSRLILSAFSGNGSEPNKTFHSGMVKGDLRRIYNTQTKQTRGILVPNREETDRSFSRIDLSPYSHEEEFSRYSSENLKTDLEYRRGQEWLQGMDLVPSSSSQMLSYKFRISSYEIGELLASARPIPVTSVKTIQYFGPVYNLGIGDDNSYIANGLIVHNCGCPVISWDTDPWHETHPYKYAHAYDCKDLADKILEIWDEVQDDPEGVQRRCRDLAEKHFDVNIEAKQVVEVLRKTVSSL